MGQSQICAVNEFPDVVDREIVGFDAKAWSPASACCAEEMTLSVEDFNWRTDLTFQYQPDPGEDENLLNSPSFVQEYGLDPSVVSASRAQPPSPGGPDLEVCAALAGFLEVDIPEDFVAGMVVTATSDCGPILVAPHAEERPGSHVQIPLRPRPEFKIEVPPGKKGGDNVYFKREDGASIFASVPDGMGPGDTFHVTPPCLMVRVPKTVQAGTSVVFRIQDDEWWKAEVPPIDCLKMNQFFFARLPVDIPPQASL